MHQEDALGLSNSNVRISAWKVQVACISLLDYNLLKLTITLQFAEMSEVSKIIVFEHLLILGAFSLLYTWSHHNLSDII